MRLALLAVVYAGFAAAASGYYVYAEFARDLPDDLAALYNKPSRATRVYSADGELIGEFFLQKRVVVPLERIPRHVQQAFISAEDHRFWDHPGFDLIGIARAAWTNYRGGATRQGASTITQQVTRMLMLSNERTYERKIKELILSIRVERELSKRDILAIYLNHSYLGHGAYGVQAASEVYFGKDVGHLTVSEAALLAGLPQAPTRYSPHRNFDAARARQRYVIDRMHADGFLTAEEARAARREPVAIVDEGAPLNHVAAPYFVERVREWATRKYGHSDVFYGGLRIFTTLDTRVQRSAEAAVRDGLEKLDRRLGFHGPIDHLQGEALAAFRDGPPHPYVAGPGSAALGSGEGLLPNVTYKGAVVELPGRHGASVDVGPRTLPLVRDDARALRRWRGENGDRVAIGDTIPVAVVDAEDLRDRWGRRLHRRRRAPEGDVLTLAQTPEVEGALVALDPETGRIRAMVGGYSYQRSQFNRATQAHRQAGSSIKPFIYATALDTGMTHLDILQDAKVSVRTAGGVWSPSNYGHEYRGPVTLRTALAKSLNTVSVRLVLRSGVEPVIEMMRRLGIESDFTRHITIALGTPDLTLLELASAYCGFANGGRRVEPRHVELVTTDDGTILEDHRDERATAQAITPQLAYLVVDLMRGVVERGTGRMAQALGRPVAGKTGTSTENRDAWFIGYTPDFLAGVWVGRDDFTPIGRRATGGATALPIWLQFMQAAHPDTPARDFEPPEDITFVRADENTGEPAPAGSRRATWVPFARGTVPSRFRTRETAGRAGTAGSDFGGDVFAE